MKRSLLILCAPVLFAQTVDSYGEAAAGIRSDDALRNAQAITIIRRDHLVQLVPDLRRILAASAATKDAADVQMAALDAMIDLGETMTPAEIQPFAESYPTFALILAAKAQGETTPLLLDLVSRAQRYEAYVATANLLLPRNSPEFARRVMGSLRTSLMIIVMDVGDPAGGVGGGYGGSSYGESRHEKSGWPMVGHYALTENDKEHPLAPGIHSIYYRRVESRDYRDDGFLGGGEDSARNRNMRNFEYAATMAGIAPKAFPIKAQEYITIPWRDVDSFVNTVQLVKNGKQQDYAAVVRTLISRGLLREDDVLKLKLDIKINVTDLRKDRTPELPKID